MALLVCEPGEPSGLIGVGLGIVDVRAGKRRGEEDRTLTHWAVDRGSGSRVSAAPSPLPFTVKTYKQKPKTTPKTRKHPPYALLVGR